MLVSLIYCFKTMSHRFGLRVCKETQLTHTRCLAQGSPTDNLQGPHYGRRLQACSKKKKKSSPVMASCDFVGLLNK